MGRRGSWSTLVQRLRRTNRSQRTRGRLIGNATTQSIKVPSSIGKGEGKLNIIAWEGYTQPQWVKPFEKTTGCVVNVKYAGSSSEMVSLMANGGGHQWTSSPPRRRGSPPHLWRRREAINIKLIPSWSEFEPFLKSPSFNTINGYHYGVSFEFDQTSSCTRPRRSRSHRRRGR